MNELQRCADFFSRYAFTVPDIHSTISAILDDMTRGLAQNSGNNTAPGSQAMIPAPGYIPKTMPRNESVIVIDAGGTNFRSCLVTFDAQGIPTISDLEKTRMPGIERELSKDAFYDAIALNIAHLKNKAAYIGFCFSYAMKITANNDGQVLNFSKEIKAPEVIGTLVGACLSDALVRHGWNKPKKITLVNDTMASLLAGAVNIPIGKKYSSYIGFILGTGLNAAYVEYQPIQKLNEKNPVHHIVVCESGLYDKYPMSVFDTVLDTHSVQPGHGLLEKKCSGAYFGHLAFILLTHACEDRLFSEQFCTAFKTVPTVQSLDIDQFLRAPFDTTTMLGAVCARGNRTDYDTLFTVLTTLYERTAHIVTAVLTAAVLKSGTGVVPTEPVRIVANGTTFWHGYNLSNTVQARMKTVLADTYHRYYEIVKIDNDITLGTAIAGCPPSEEK
ncbi:MAG: hexokinase [Treponema sp.]|nr:hexokinase [Treponema sp.]